MGQEDGFLKLRVDRTTGNQGSVDCLKAMDGDTHTGINHDGDTTSASTKLEDLSPINREAQERILAIVARRKPSNPQ